MARCIAWPLRAQRESLSSAEAKRAVAGKRSAPACVAKGEMKRTPPRRRPAAPGTLCYTQAANAGHPKSFMTTRHLIVGLDGADLDVIEGLGPKRLPNLFGLMERGAYARLESVMPPATLPNWTTFLTAQDPGRHGVFDFTTRQGYQVRFTAGSVREEPTVFARLDRLGLRCACIGFPATWPPERLEHGVFISGWDAPVAFQSDASFVWPPALHERIKERFGEQRFDDVDEFDADSPGWREALPGALEERIAKKTELAQWLLEGQDWDVFAFYFGESDTAAHHLWALHDANSPRHRKGYPSDGLGRIYAALDTALGKLLETAGEGVELTVVSDHGSGGAGDRVLHLNRALAELDLLTFHGGQERSKALPRERIVSAAKEAALTLLPPALRERLFRIGNAALPSWLESQARFGAIDMRRTIAFSDELNYFPGVWLNIRGRDPEGFVEQSDLPRVRRLVAQKLRSLKDPYDGGPAIEDVFLREELYSGPFVHRAPDLILKLRLPGGYSYNLMPSGGPGETWRRLEPSEYLGRKGRSLAGSHRDFGFYCAAGPSVAAVGEVEATMADTMATALGRLGVAPPEHCRGRVLFEILDELVDAQALPEAELLRGSQGDEAAVERRLRALGYID